MVTFYQQLISFCDGKKTMGANFEQIWRFSSLLAKRVTVSPKLKLNIPKTSSYEISERRSLSKKKQERKASVAPLPPWEKKPVTGRLLQNEKLTATASPLQTEAKNSCHPTPANYNPTTPAITYTLPGLVLILCHGKSWPLKKCHPHPVFFDDYITKVKTRDKESSHLLVSIRPQNVQAAHLGLVSPRFLSTKNGKCFTELNQQTEVPG